MKLYLVQHGEAKAKAEDPARPLTRRGEDDVARVGAFVRHAGIEVDQICHSGKLRAEQTAAILAEHLNPPQGVITRSGLSPDDDVRPVAAWLDRQTRPLLLVGHLPFMERLAGLLVAGDAERSVVRFHRGGMVCLEHDPDSGAWSVLWAISPDLI